jgi:NMD protein affecting ribosome stability and mRNA decay
MQPFLDRISEARNTRAAEKGLLDNGKEMHLYAILDPITIMKMREKGIDIYSGDKDMQRKMFDEINANYPKCKVTDKTHR